MAFLGGAWAGKFVNILPPATLRRAAPADRSQDILAYFHFARFLTVIVLACFLFVIRPLLWNPQNLFSLFRVDTGLLSYKYFLTDVNPNGYATLINLNLLSFSLYLTLLAGPSVSRKIKSKVLKDIAVLLTFFYVPYIIFITSRSLVLYVFLSATAIYLLQSKTNSVFFFSISAFAAASFAFLMEWLRWGWIFSQQNDLSLVDLRTMRFVLEILVYQYIAADFNSALVLLAHPSSYNLLWGSSLSFFFPGDPVEIANLSGTIHLFGIWWISFGCFAYPLVFFMGFLLEHIYLMALRSPSRINLYLVLYLMAYPGLFAITRINYFLLNSFLVPLAFFLVFSILLSMRQGNVPIPIHAKRGNLA
ncbi:MAG: hypothetical protein ACE15F_24690 [bacterium]